MVPVMADHVFFNGGQVSVVYTATGLSLDVQERVEGDPANPVLTRLVAAGLLTDLGAVPTPLPVKADAEPAAKE